MNRKKLCWNPCPPQDMISSCEYVDGEKRQHRIDASNKQLQESKVKEMNEEPKVLCLFGHGSSLPPSINQSRNLVDQSNVRLSNQTYQYKYVSGSQPCRPYSCMHHTPSVTCGAISTHNVPLSLDALCHQQRYNGSHIFNSMAAAQVNLDKAMVSQGWCIKWVQYPKPQNTAAPARSPSPQISTRRVASRVPGVTGARP